MNKTIQPTSQQMNIIEEQGNIVVTAKPGSGKTYTIIEKILDISEDLLDYQSVIAISFTRKASEELELRYKGKRKEITKHFFGTIDKFYICEIIIPFTKILLNKVITLEVKDSIDNYPKYKDLKKMKGNIKEKQLVDLLKESLEEGMIFLEIIGETALYILDEVPECLTYLKARYTHIFIDEYQDCGEVQHLIFLKLVKKGIKGISVGDLDQSIFAFADKYSKYLFELMGSKDFIHLEITSNHRCHKSISDYSLELMGAKKDAKIEKNKRVFKVTVLGTDKDIIKNIEENIGKLKKQYKINKNSDFAILCKTKCSANRASEFLKIDNKLFIDTVLDEFYSNWANLFKDFLSSYYLYQISEITIIDFVTKYVSEDLNYRNFKKSMKLVEKLFNLNENELKDNSKEFYKIALLAYPEQKDKEIIKILKGILNNPEELNSFKPATDNELNIMTIHKSKGLEFKCVFLLDSYKYILPYEGYGATTEDCEQGLNLHYVGITRSIEACYIMLSAKRYRQSQNDFIRAIESPFLNLNKLSDLRINSNSI